MLFSTWRPDGRHRPRFTGDPRGTLRFRWLGTACFVVETDTTTIVIDPFVTRPSLGRIAFSKITPDLAEIQRRFPAKVDAVVCGHAHYDHLLDAPPLALATGARFVGSASAAHFARASGVPEDRIDVVTRRGAAVRVGDMEIQLVPSLHGRYILRRFYLASGDVDAPPTLPAHISAYKMGGAFGVVVRGAGVTLYHNGSADLVDAELEGIKADVLVAGLAGRFGTRDYLGRLVRALDPSVIVPTHHDAFFASLDRGIRLLPGIDLDGFVEEARLRAPSATAVLPRYEETIVVPSDGPRGVGLVRART